MKAKSLFCCVPLNPFSAARTGRHFLKLKCETGLLFGMLVLSIYVLAVSVLHRPLSRSLLEGSVNSEAAIGLQRAEHRMSEAEINPNCILPIMKSRKCT
jgi:hypothetical protein